MEEPAVCARPPSRSPRHSLHERGKGDFLRGAAPLACNTSGRPPATQRVVACVTTLRASCLACSPEGREAVLLGRPAMTLSWECAPAWPRVPGRGRARARRWRAWERSIRSLLIWGAFVCLALFYLVRTRDRRAARAGPRALTCHTRRPRAGRAAAALQRGPRAAWGALASCRPRVSMPIAAAAAARPAVCAPLSRGPHREKKHTRATTRAR